MPFYTRRTVTVLLIVGFLIGVALGLATADWGFVAR